VSISIWTPPNTTPARHPSASPIVRAQMPPCAQAAGWRKSDLWRAIQSFCSSQSATKWAIKPRSNKVNIEKIHRAPTANRSESVNPKSGREFQELTRMKEQISEDSRHSLQKSELARKLSVLR
jgi:hypothetical protein